MEATADHPATTDLHLYLTGPWPFVEDALTFFDPIHLSYDHAKATRIRDRITEKFAALAP